MQRARPLSNQPLARAADFNEYDGKALAVDMVSYEIASEKRHGVLLADAAVEYSDGWGSSIFHFHHLTAFYATGMILVLNMLKECHSVVARVILDDSGTHGMLARDANKRIGLIKSDLEKNEAVLRYFV